MALIQGMPRKTRCSLSGRASDAKIMKGELIDLKVETFLDIQVTSLAIQAVRT